MHYEIDDNNISVSFQELPEIILNTDSVKANKRAGFFKDFTVNATLPASGKNHSGETAEQIFLFIILSKDYRIKLTLVHNLTKDVFETNMKLIAKKHDVDRATYQNRTDLLTKHKLFNISDEDVVKYVNIAIDKFGKPLNRKGNDNGYSGKTRKTETRFVTDSLPEWKKELLRQSGRA